MKSYKLFWVTHKWVGIVLALVILNIAGTGILLLFKKDVAWIQPPTQRGVASNEFGIGFEDVLTACRSDPRLEVSTWDDIDRLDVRPGKGMMKVRTNNSWEAQVDLATGELLQVQYRRSDLIESIHDGSFFGDWAHDWVWTATALSLFFLAFSGYWLWIEPKVRRARRKKRARAPAGR